MAQWRIELTTQDVVALSDGREITVPAVDEEQDLTATSAMPETLDVTITLLDV
jgi:hypothetical protein